LFPKEDVDGLIGGLRNEAKGFGVVDNTESMTAYFMDKIRK
jgi:hypothetical protein